MIATDGMPPPSDLPDGELIARRIKDSIWIAHADPRILIAAPLLAQIFINPMAGVSLGPPQEAENGTPFWEGATLKICAVNRTVIYRITEYVPRVRGYIGEWPD